jgi:opacity protein-like surface antigen
MQIKFLVGCITALLAFSAFPASAQSVYAAHEDRPRFSIGAGFSDFSQDWGNNPRVLGTTFYADYRPPFLPDFLNGLSLQLEARDLRWNRGTYPANVFPPTAAGKPIVPRTDTLGGGLIYHAERLKFHKFVPYAKGIVSFGSIDFTLPHSPTYSHDTRTVTSLGGGLDYRLARRLTLRGDYEYQWWPQMFSANALNPNGFTIGALYNFGHSGH